MKNLIVFISLIFVVNLSATVINIPADQPTIQEGINVSVSGDTVLVQPGIYFENINYNSKNITVASLFFIDQDTTYISQTIIDGNNCFSCVIFDNDEDSTAVLSGFTIQNGFGSGSFSYWYGGGITINSASPTIQNCTISHNFNDIRGGGVAIWYNSNPLFKDCIISDNSNWGIYMYGSDAEFIHTLIVNNEYGIRCNLSNVLLMNCDIINNIGTGIKCLDNSNPIILNSIVWNNDTNVTFFHGYNPNTITISYSDFQGGEESIVPNNNGSINWLEGNIDANPLFVDTLNGDFHLSEISPCIDAGDPNSPLDPDGTIADMGAIYFPQSSNAEGCEIQNPNILLNNFPNPFNPITTIEFSILNNSMIELLIYNIKGQKIKTLIHNKYTKGSHSVIWRGDDDNGLSVSSGFYLYKLNVNGKTEAVKKCLLLK